MGFILLLGGTLIASTLCGLIIYLLLSYLFYPIIFGSIGAGLLIGFVGGIIIRKTKFRNTFLSTLVGIISGCFCMFSIYYFSYLHFKWIVSKEIAQEIKVGVKNLDKTKVESYLQNHIYESTGKKGGLGYFCYESQRGIRIRNAIVKGVGFYIIKGIELLLIVIISTIFLFGATREAFCEICNEWFNEKEIFRIKVKDTNNVTKLINKCDYKGLEEEKERTKEENKNAKIEFIFKISHCPQCKMNSTMTINLRFVKKDGEVEEKLLLTDKAVNYFDLIPIINS